MNLIDNAFVTALIDIQSYSAKNDNHDLNIELRNNQDCELDKSYRPHKNGSGYLLKSDHGEGIDAEITCFNEGFLKLNLRSMDVRKKDNQRINILIDYRKLIINHQIIFEDIVPCSYDDPFSYSLPVKKDQKISIHLEWEKHNYESLEFYKIISMLAETFLNSKLEKSEIEKKLIKKDKEIEEIKRELKNIKTGWSYKSGRVITFLPRIFRNWIKR